MRVWIRSVDDLRTRDGAPIEDRSILLFRARGRERSSEVIDFDEGKTFALRSVQGSFTAVYRYRVAADAGATNATLEVDCSAVGLSKLFAPLIGRIAWLTDRSQLEFLKNAVESTQPREPQ